MARYIKKPIEIEAFQLNSRGLVEEDWFWGAVTRNDIITHSFGKHEIEDAWCEIKTLEGTMIARTGDYIIRGIKGEIYPCRADIFEETYQSPTADVEEVQCGEWIKYPSDAYMKCSVCGMEYPKEKMPNVVGYCPNPKCGAKMDGGNK